MVTVLKIKSLFIFKNLGLFLDQNDGPCLIVIINILLNVHLLHGKLFQCSKLASVHALILWAI